MEHSWKLLLQVKNVYTPCKSACASRNVIVFVLVLLSFLSPPWPGILGVGATATSNLKASTGLISYYWVIFSHRFTTENAWNNKQEPVKTKCKGAGVSIQSQVPATTCRDLPGSSSEKSSLYCHVSKTTHHRAPAFYPTGWLLRRSFAEAEALGPAHRTLLRQRANMGCPNR